MLKRFLIISGLLLVLFNLASQGTLGGYYFLSSNGPTTIGHSPAAATESAIFIVTLSPSMDRCWSASKSKTT